MREVLRRLDLSRLENVSLGYDAWAPVGEDGKVPERERPQWLARLADLPVSPDYRHAFERWRSSFTRPGDRLREVTLAGRLLIGHGNPSAAEVGLTVHHPWGVPVVPGSALKGLLAHYVEAVYGPENPDPPPWEQSGEERERARYQGVTWEGRRIRRGPGEWYRRLFGAPEADEDGIYEEHGLGHGASRGEVVFHDALYVPGSAGEDRPYAVDVLTVHQKPYYDAHLRGPADRAVGIWPSDHASPNPVAFLTVRPRVRLLLALSGPPEWTETAEELLLDALERWGVGAKTSAGYGRILSPEAGAGDTGDNTGVTPSPRYRRWDRITVTRIEDSRGRGRAWFQAPDGCLGQFLGETPPEVEVGETVEVWVANAGPIYTLTLRPPEARGAKGKERKERKERRR
ncbi:MAG TPA: type III-B CRISPR module RAMP protein Cmr6 [Candidatus Dormibacteraeota bacterium]|nr:type III-B CRISPR module RAMP protein Cmr6 [Candidatus Dormibacteraeota bacterium]